MRKNQNITPSLFSSNTANEGDSQEIKIESKLNKRQENFLSEDNFSQIKEKENTMKDELSLGYNFRNKMLNLKRLKQKRNQVEKIQKKHQRRKRQQKRMK